MGRLPITDTAGEAIGFAGRHYEDALRLTWLPILLSVGWLALSPGVAAGLALTPYGGALAAALSGLVGLAISAMIYGPLLRLAARGEAPDHGTAPLRLGWSPLRYVAGSVLSLGGALAVSAPVFGGAAEGLLGRTEAMRAADVAVFEPGSLHSVDFVPAFDPGQIGLVEAIPFAALALAAALLWSWSRSVLWTVILAAGFLFAQLVIGQLLIGQLVIGQSAVVELPASWPPVAALLVPASFLIAGYAMLRLSPLPWFWAARRREDDWPVLRSTLSVSAGIGRFRLLAVIGLLAVFNFVLGWLLQVVPLAFGLGLVGADAFLSGVTTITNGGRPADWLGMALSGASLTFGYLFAVATTAFGAGVTAGLGGALVRHATAD